MLIKKGWKPFNREKTLHIICYDKCKWINYKWVHLDGWFMNEESRTLRELVSIESWLWQFCIANHLLKKYSDLWDDWEYIIGRWQDWKDCKTEDWEYIDDNRDTDIYHQDDSYQRWLIESSLKDESELEDFLLQNIKVWNED